jgi:hypothetical protein
MKNKRFLLLTPLLLLLYFGGRAETPPVEALRSQYPYAELAATAIDLGKIAQGRQASGSITLTNTGEHPLLIGTVRSSCGLMIPSWPTGAIAPGAQATINFRYDGSRIGAFERIISIHTNAWQKTIQVKVSGEVVPPPPEVPQ